ncbi:sigma-70 family RNA polymerase sigma factor [Streptomyces sp. XM4193]|uniref:BACON domain-containing protein n=1 Tax=Streptomyces sp. XM4193 TaxID=2929782 RepID=UPI001FF9F484|nr:sigma-70 family RNA polymerase sigma factor [Streptomyces sp. XM4193]MCK1798271.1 sigma-70 family RNA polymerase sigma factor [Streptomyces sp. XM4193]
MSSRREHPTNSTGARQARRGSRHPGNGPAPAALSGAAAAVQDVHGAGDDPYLDGLFTYCLSIMCEHDEAVSALGLALSVAERQRERDRAPQDPAHQRPWLYALARWACLRRLATLREAARPREPIKLDGPLATRRRQELAALGWPEAAGTTPEQREALELAVRHQLPVDEVALVLSMESAATRMLLSGAACEVERTRAALSVVNSGGCGTVSRLGGDTEVVLSAALRRELVRHVDECGECRLAAEKHMAGEPWPGTAPGRSRQLAVLKASRPVVHAALVAALRARAQPAPRFDRHGFPAEAKERTARMGKLRARAVTTTVAAAVVAAPVLALWAAYRGAPLVGEGRDGSSVATSDADDPAAEESYPYENAGNADRAPGDRKSPNGRTGDDRDGEEDDGKPGGSTKLPGGSDDPDSSPDEGSESPDESPSESPGRLSVQARPAGDVTLITLTNTGGSKLDWSAATDARWLRVSKLSGQLSPGESYTVRVDVRRWEPEGPWTARVHFAPSGTVITIQGQGREPAPEPSEPEPSEPAPDPEPSEPVPSA